MRSFWLASAASLFIAGAACAQTATTGPAPTGAPNAPTVTSPGQSPGNMGTNTTSRPTSSDNSGGGVNNASGAPQGATVTTPGTSPGKTTSAGSASDMMGTPTKPMASMSGMKTIHHHHYGMGMGMGGGRLPADASVGTYLHIAKGSVMHHNKMMADDALAHAETRMLDRSVPQGGIAADTSSGVSAIESARKAEMAGDTKTALAQIDMAMQQSGGMGDAGMSPAPMAAAPMAAPMSSSGMSGSFKPATISAQENKPETTGAASKDPGKLGTMPDTGGAPETPAKP